MKLGTHLLRAAWALPVAALMMLTLEAAPAGAAIGLSSDASAQITPCGLIYNEMRTTAWDGYWALAEGDDEAYSFAAFKYDFLFSLYFPDCLGFGSPPDFPEDQSEDPNVPG